jgi:transcriptional regulator with XRE-family HTH domain
MTTYIGEQIKNLRNNKKLSQVRFGQKIGISAKTISAYERGVCTPSLRVLEEINTVYKVAIVELNDADAINLKEKIQSINDSIKELEKLLFIKNE